MKQVCVTGSHGFIGGWVIEELLRRGHGVLAFDRHRDTVPGHYPAGVEVFLGDTTNAQQVTEAFAHADGWIHLAAVLGTQETIGNPRPAVLENVAGGLNVLEAAAQYRLPGVYIGVGNHWMNNPYSISKTMVERLCLMYSADRGCRINIVRGMNAYGPRQRAATPFGPGKVRKIMPAFCCRALSGLPVEVYGDGQQVSDMVWVGDLARTLVAALESAEQGDVAKRVIECGPAEHSTVEAVAEMVCREAFKLRAYPGPWIKFLPMRPGEIPGATVSADQGTLAQVGIDPTAFKPLSDGVRETVAWFHANKGVTWSTP